MKKLLIFLFFISLNSFSQESNYTASQKDLDYYGLKYVDICDDNGTKIQIAIPPMFERVSKDFSPDKVVAAFKHQKGNSPPGTGLYFIQIDRLESINTIKFVDNY